MFGIDFDGHPHLVPLLLPDGFEGHPLRKDFVLAARVAKAWPGAKEPGESDADAGHAAPSRRKTPPPGVPDPRLGPAPADGRRAAARPGRRRRPAAGGRRRDATCSRSRCASCSCSAPSWCCRCSSGQTEHKVMAHMQGRLGPMYAGGFHGWAQLVADGVKFAQKEDIVPAGADRTVFRLAPAVALIPYLVVLVAIPLAPGPGRRRTSTPACSSCSP